MKAIHHTVTPDKPLKNFTEWVKYHKRTNKLFFTDKPINLQPSIIMAAYQSKQAKNSVFRSIVNAFAIAGVRMKESKYL